MQCACHHDNAVSQLFSSGAAVLVPPAVEIRLLGLQYCADVRRCTPLPTPLSDTAVPLLSEPRPARRPAIVLQAVQSAAAVVQLPLATATGATSLMALVHSVVTAAGPNFGRPFGPTPTELMASLLALLVTSRLSEPRAAAATQWQC